MGRAHLTRLRAEHSAGKCPVQVTGHVVNNPRNMTGIGTTKGTKETRTTTTNSSANIFPKSRKLSDRGFVKYSKILIGKRIGVG
ncbi:hypothetical protein Hanom_Chr01g00040761 [Helianthus anomalus]